jgi:hypothetical protein
MALRFRGGGRRRKEDPFDLVIKGLTAANAGLGIVGKIQDLRVASGKLGEQERAEEKAIAQADPKGLETGLLAQRARKAGVEVPKGFTAQVGLRTPGFLKQIETKEAALVKEPKEPKGSQFIAAGFAQRVSDAEEIFTKLENKGFRAEGAGAATQRALGEAPLVGGVLEGFKSEDVKQQSQAERSFVNAVLRRESGAVINPSEFANAEVQYFPRIGDDAATIKQKRLNRLAVVAALKAEAGPALTKMRQQLQKETALSAATLRRPQDTETQPRGVPPRGGGGLIPRAVAGPGGVEKVTFGGKTFVKQRDGNFKAQ